MKTYITKQGDKWDNVAAEVLGSELLADRLMLANQSLLNYYIFPEGIMLNIPEAETAIVTENDLPPWKRVSG